MRQVSVTCIAFDQAVPRAWRLSLILSQCCESSLGAETPSPVDQLKPSGQHQELQPSLKASLSS